MGAKAVRQGLEDALGDALPDVKVVGHADDITPEPGHDVLIVYVDKVGPTEVMTTAALAYSVKVLVAVAKTNPGEADDALDDLLDQVLAILDDEDQLLWSLAERGAYLESFPSYIITVEVRA